jgi:hypothetical protein
MNVSGYFMTDIFGVVALALIGCFVQPLYVQVLSTKADQLTDLYSRLNILGMNLQVRETDYLKMSRKLRLIIFVMILLG